VRFAALDAEFGFRARAFDYTQVEPVCLVLRIAGGPTIIACPRLGHPWAAMTPLLQDPDLLIFTHHGAFAERQVLQRLNLPFPPHWWDTEVAERVLDITTEGDLARDEPLRGQGPYTLLGCLGRAGDAGPGCGRQKGSAGQDWVAHLFRGGGCQGSSSTVRRMWRIL